MQPGPFHLLNQLLHNFGRGLDTLYRADRLSCPERHRPDRSRRRLIGDATREANDRNSRPIQAARLADYIALEGFRCHDGDLVGAAIASPYYCGGYYPRGAIPNTAMPLGTVLPGILELLYLPPYRLCRPYWQ